MMTLGEDVVLAAHNISKKYTVKQSRASEKKSKDTDFWALQDVSFELKKGQIMGIIGANGAGKSTILKLLSEIIAPTSGHISYKGTILSILEIGTGFHPDLSGYENIFLNASLLGMKKKQIREKADEIIAFSGVAAHIHEPVKNYSNGMYLRLALSIALFTNNEILLLDEVISVGDTEFRMRAIKKVKEQSQQGKACIIISHDLNSVLELCDTCLLLEKGKVIYSGTSKATVENYFDRLYNNVHKRPEAFPEHPSCQITSVEIEKEIFQMDEPIRVKINYHLKMAEDLRILLIIKTYHGFAMLDSFAFRPDYTGNVLAPGYYQTVCELPANLFNAGTYLVNVRFGKEFELFFDLEMAGRFKVDLKAWEAGKNWNKSGEAIPFRPLCLWETKALEKKAGI